MARKNVVLSSIDIGGWAAHYADNTFGYGHFKHEVYPLFADMLASAVRPGGRILDIGAGPGNMMYEYGRTHPRRPLKWVLVDASARLLEIAQGKVKTAKRKPEVHVRSYNQAGWDKGLGLFNAIVSNNSLFHVKPRGLTGFYRVCAAHLRKGGFMLNQQSFAYSGAVPPHADRPFERFMQKMSEKIMPPNPVLLDPKQRALRAERKREAEKAHGRARAEAAVDGTLVNGGQTGYNFLTVERHLGAMRRAGLDAGCIWRKREFAVICGVKT